MRPLAGPWLSVSISPALRSGHKGHALGPFTATAQMLGSIFYGWGQRSPVNLWFHSIHQLYGHGASGRRHMQGITGGHGSSDCLTGPLHSPADRGVRGSLCFYITLRLITKRTEMWWMMRGKVTGWVNDEMSSEKYDFETEARTKTEMSVCICGKFQSPNLHQQINEAYVIFAYWTCKITSWLSLYTNQK